jgi:hypothetical protein
MPIDPMLVGGLKPVEYDPQALQLVNQKIQGGNQDLRFGDLRNAIAGQNLQQQQLATTQGQQAAYDEQQVRDLYASAVKPDGTVDHNAMMAGLMRISPKHAEAYKAHQIEQQKKLAELGETQLKNKKAAAELVGNTLAGVKDEATKNAAVDTLAASGLIAPQEAQQYKALPYGDPTLMGHIQTAVAQATATKDQVENAIKATAEKRQQAESTAKLPGIAAESDQKATEARRQERITAAQTVVDAKDQPSYTAWLQQQPKSIQDTYGPMFSPQKVEAIRQAGMSEMERQTQQGQAATRAEISRHNKTEEGLTARGQNMVDRRAHEQLLLHGGQQNATTEGKLRDDYRTESKDFKTVDTSYRKVIESAKSNNGTGDMSMVYGIMKMLDPGSTVREGEYANASQVGGAAANYLNTYNRLLKGEKLPQSARDQIVAEAGKLLSVEKTKQARIDDYYGGLAERYKLDKRNVMTDYGTGAVAPAVNGNTVTFQGKTYTGKSPEQAAAFAKALQGK